MAKQQKTPEINRAIRDLTGELHIRQVDLARWTGCAQPAVHKWIMGAPGGSDVGVGPSLSQIPHIEDSISKAIGIPIRGEIFRRAIKDDQPYAPPARSTLESIMMDKDINFAYKGVVADAYKLAVELSAALRRGETPSQQLTFDARGYVAKRAS